MERIAESLLNGYVADNDLLELDQSAQFEHMAAFLMLRRHYSRAFDTFDIVTGSGSDTGVDAIALIANGVLVTDVDQIEDLVRQNGYLDVSFVFVQAERTEGFSAAKVGTIGNGVIDFFDDSHKLPRNDKVAELASFAKEVYRLSRYFSRRRPNCMIYYVTTGEPRNEAEIEAGIFRVREQLKNSRMFNDVVFDRVGSADIQKSYHRVTGSVTREFIFDKNIELPPVAGVDQAYLGYIRATELVSIITDDAGDYIIGNIFHDNVRDWQQYNEVNAEIRETLRSDSSDRFLLLNNGITVIASKLVPSGHTRFSIEDFQIVNGCQTSNVLFDSRDNLTDNVFVPLRLIASTNDEVVRSIVRGTNRQNDLGAEQLYALTDFSRKLEGYFSTFLGEQRIYYERRDGQYDRSPAVIKRKIINPQSQIKSFAAMFLDEPHTAAKNYKTLKDLVGAEVFVETHRLEPYFVSALAFYYLDVRFNSRIDVKYKSARYHLLLAARLLMDSRPLPELGSREMQKRGEAMIKYLSDGRLVDELFSQAIEIIDEVSGGDLSRDNIRTLHTTNAIKSKLENIALT